ncbi:MAG: hypothetical protein M3290_07415 [Actinomycetota bacterium]|nr:hypothetical protein [Actinomycetota bacterium]
MFETEHHVAAPEMAEILERVVVAPATGRFTPHPPEVLTTEGEWVQEGQSLGEIAAGRESVPVVSAFTGWMMGMLAIPGQPVSVGDPLFWIRP